LVGASEVVLKDPRLKKYRVLDTVVAAEKEQETKCKKRKTVLNLKEIWLYLDRKKLFKDLRRKRRNELSKFNKHHLSNVEEAEENEDDGDEW
jgi:hypothetical protein